MATAEERLKILKMIDEGKTSAEEGAKLLAALMDSQKTPPRPPVRNIAGGNRWLRVRVTDTITGKTKATVNLPMRLVDAGLKIA
ncbi:MAG: SHOCT-like domain-containing protein, partial [Anaerolineales bacterium]